MASRPDTKAGSDRAIVEGQVIPALDRVLAWLALLDAFEDGPELDQAAIGIRDTQVVLSGANDALYDADAKRAVQTVIDSLKFAEESS